ncbi:hypothetical protein [Paracoccus marinaquae]|uniref:Lipoprotein n=1 Tax=Paracoccus marinaquae TaxID=2841926 RepID=A0ABS6AKK3_9RHOB|nr:hypothetical protein [Paracoccus marinaquae]MBU3029946.1 hypothetical protein [Paracoccus marinaquae]
MKFVLVPTIAAAAALLAACTPATEVDLVTVTDVPAETLNAATGMPGTAIVAASRMENEYSVIYRVADVTPEQVAAAPAKICAFTDKSVFAAGGEALPDSGLTEGLAEIAVTCD